MILDSILLSQKIKIVAALVLVSGAAFLAVLPLFNAGKIAHGIWLGDLHLGARTPAQARAILDTRIGQYQNYALTIKTEKEELRASPKEIGLIFNPAATIEKAVALSQGGAFPLRALRQAKIFLFSERLPMQVKYNEDHFIKFKQETLSRIHRPARNAALRYDEKTEQFILVPAEEGQIIDIPLLREELLKRARRLTREPISVTQRRDIPDVKDDEVDRARSQAQNILASGPYYLYTEEMSWPIEKEDLIDWITFAPKNNAENNIVLGLEPSLKKISSYLTQFSPGLNQPPVNAEFAMAEGKVTAFRPSQNGRELNIAKSAERIALAMENRKTNITPERVNIELIIEEARPEITTQSANDLGVETLLGKGESNFAGSPASRKHNIRVGSEKFQGILIAPGEEFSFNQNLGPVTAKEGYLPELVIKKDKTVPEYGGGLCQVSTTMFRAAINSGLQITERYPHSYPVKYYSPQGFDATIYPPHPDLRFQNNTSAHILLQYKIEGNKLTWETYGPNEGRKVVIDGPHQYDIKPDGSMKAWLKQTVYAEDDEVLLEKTFYSSYKSPDKYPVDRNPLE